MANSQEIAKFYASLGIKVEKAELVKVDRFLKQMGDKFSKFKGGNLNIRKFSVDQKALNIALKESFTVASRTVSFEIGRFTVNERALRSTLSGIEARAARGVSGASGLGAGSMLGRALLPIAGVAAGGYGLSSLNQRNQQVVSAQLQSQAVVQQAGGTTQQGTDSFNWLRAQGNRIGFDYLKASPDYNKLLSGLTGAGMSVKQGQNVFKGFAEYSRVQKLDRVAQQRLFRALSQVAGKGKLQAEELNYRLAA